MWHIHCQNVSSGMKYWIQDLTNIGITWYGQLLVEKVEIQYVGHGLGEMKNFSLITILMNTTTHKPTNTIKLHHFVSSIYLIFLTLLINGDVGILKYVIIHGYRIF